MTATADIARPRRDATVPVRHGRTRPLLLAATVMTPLAVALAWTAHRVPYFPADLTVMRSVQQLHAVWLTAPLTALSVLGFPPVVDIVYGTIALALFLVGLRREGITAALIALGAAGINEFAKTIVARPRPPDVLVHVVHHIPNSSFPAGHVLNATAFMGFLCTVAATHMAPSWRRAVVISLLLVAIAGMGLARVYSGEHWPSDVLGGYLLGAIWFCLALSIHRWTMASALRS